MGFFSSRRAQPPKDETPSEPNLPQTGALTARQPVGFETVIGSNSTLYGELRCQSDVRIDGTFEGTLEIEGNVLVGESGKINADIHAKNVSVAGAVRGDISGKKVQLLRTARVWGNITASAITTEEGAFIDGKLTMSQHTASTTQLEVNALPAPQDSSDDSELENLEVVEGEAVEDSSASQL